MGRATAEGVTTRSFRATEVIKLRCMTLQEATAGDERAFKPPTARIAHRGRPHRGSAGGVLVGPADRLRRRSGPGRGVLAQRSGRRRADADHFRTPTRRTAD